MDKVTDPTHIARGIARKVIELFNARATGDPYLDMTLYVKSRDIIAAALREYGQAEYLNGITAVQKNTTEIEQKADAEGYERGRKTEFDRTFQENLEVAKQAELRGYHRGVEESKKCDCICAHDVKELQRGTGGGE